MREFTLPLAVILPAFLWSYWPILLELKDSWDRVADYSHGYLVAPVAVYFLWARRGTCPPASATWGWGGLVLLLVAFAIRTAGALWYFEALQGWSIVPWVGGVIWLLGGYARFRWSLPTVMFLVFMVPLPYSAESMLSVPLQGVATRLSCWFLQLIGQPAITEGHVILLHQTPLLVAEACSGLRIFISVLALAYIFLVLVRKAWWTRLALVAGVLPVALASNVMRIVVTGLLHEYTSNEAAQRFSHDFAGWLMLPFAAALMSAILWYCQRIFIEVRTVSTGELLAAASLPVRAVGSPR